MLGLIGNFIYLHYPAVLDWYNVHAFAYRAVQTLLFHGFMAAHGIFSLVFGDIKLEWKYCYKTRDRSNCTSGKIKKQFYLRNSWRNGINKFSIDLKAKNLTTEEKIEITEENAQTIWDWCNEYIRLNKIKPQSLIEKSNVNQFFHILNAVAMPKGCAQSVLPGLHQSRW